MTDKLLDDLKAALGEAYLIERELTGGGMSRVFVAREHALGREVVIKVLPPELAAGINRERFRREIQLAARISHPYIVPLLHAGEAGELLWFTMPYIPGQSLRTRLEEHGPLPLRDVLQLLRDVVEALAYAHSRGVIHRDIKPANILSDGVHALVTDFGVAKALGASLPLTGVAGHTTSGMAIGTPAYMAPEQLAADPSADHRVDIYAVGLLAYELLSGASPFAAPSPTATMTAQLTRTPESLVAVRPDVPLAFSQLVDRCLAKSADQRPADAQAVLAELEKVSGALVAEEHRGDSGEREAVGRRASSLPLIFAGLGVVALVAAGVMVATRSNPGRAAAASPETVLVQGGSDSAEGEALPADRPMTRADSLAIAAALRDELARLDPEAERTAPVSVPATTGRTDQAPVVSLQQQLTLVDSMVRIRLGELTSRDAAIAAAEARQTAGRVAPPPTSPRPERRSVLVVSQRSRGNDSSNDSAMVRLGREVAAELSSRLTRSADWTVVSPEEVERGDRELPAEVLVTVGASRTAGDSAMLRIGVRNLSPGSNFGYNVITSRNFALADGGRGYRQTVNQALEVLSDLRRVDRGDVWMIDMGRGPTRGPSVEQMRVFDSMRRNTPRPPGTP